MGKILLFLSFFGLLLFPKGIDISGRVLNEDGNAIPGVKVTVKGTEIFTYTDIGGYYVLKNVPEDAKTIVFTCEGLTTKEISIKGKENVDVTMKNIKGYDDVNSIVRGKVTDEYGNALAGVSVVVEGTGFATVTDVDGNYIIENVPDDSEKLIFSFMGMETEKTKISGEVVDISLISTDEEIEDVDVTGLGIKKYGKSVSYSYSDDAYMIDGDRSIKDGGYDYAETDVGVGYDANIRSGQLTAGEVNDFGKWEMWQDITQEALKDYIALWGIHPKDRYCVLLTDQDNKPVINADVYLKSGNETIWAAKTDNTGKAELWANMFDENSTGNLSIQTDFRGTVNSIENPTSFHNGINKLSIHTECHIPNEIDIAFIIDATSSMGDEMSYIQAEVLNVINRIDTTHKDLTVNLGSVFYRDEGDDYVTKFKDFSSDYNSAVSYIKEQRAWGGGDFPEAVDEALDVAVNQMSWSDDSRAKIIFIVLDAPPHNSPEAVEKLAKATKDAAAKGIRIIPITCSGIDKSTEYLMRSMALATNGTYVFLTDDSGIGNSHIKPTTDKWDVEFLNDLIVRLVNQYVLTPDCENHIYVDQQDIKEDTIIISHVEPVDIDTNIVTDDTVVTDTNNVTVIEPIEHNLKIYPNPTSGDLTLEVTGEITEFFVCDMSGKILERHQIDGESEVKIYIGSYPQGIYFIRYFVGHALKSGKVVLIY